MRPHLIDGGLRRTIVSWFLIDETVGLALASPSQADRTLLRSGLVGYLAWVSDTAIGVAGGAAVGLRGLASAVFPVLSVGLAALMVRGATGLARAGVGATVTLILLFIWPGLAGLAPILGGVVAALPGGGGE